MGLGKGRIPYNILHHITDPEAPKQWSINHMDPRKTDKRLSEDLADYFIKITDKLENQPASGGGSDFKF